MSITLQSLKISLEELHDAIKKEYSTVAEQPLKGYHFHTGCEATDRIGYDQELYKNIPKENIESFAGTGNPFGLGPINEGDVIVDVGSGAGLDSLIASQLVGPTGRVVGIDMTHEMLIKSRHGANKMGASNTEFREGYADNLPLPDKFADVVISNGVLNLTPEKAKTLKDWARVLKPGGRLYIGDILVSKKIPQSALNDISLWTGWIAGGLLEADLIDLVERSGFENVKIQQRHNIFEGVPNPSSALDFGTIGISLSGQKSRK